MNSELKTEKDYRELARLGKVLGVPVFEAFLTVETFDKNGKRTSYHKQRSHSWTRNAYNLMMSTLATLDGDDAAFSGGNINFKDTGGTIRQGSYPLLISADGFSVQGAGGGYRGSATNDDRSILVGTGTNAESFEDVALQTKVVSGNGAGELAYGEGNAVSESYVSGTKSKSAAYVRYFNNNSGGTITITEIALAGFFLANNNAYNVLVARDKLGSGVAVADTGQLKVTYQIALTYAG